jgi:hypothetical protein
MSIDFQSRDETIDELDVLAPMHLLEPATTGHCRVNFYFFNAASTTTVRPSGSGHAYPMKSESKARSKKRKLNGVMMTELTKMVTT